jgi:CHAD domain-containing protein
MSRSFRSTYHDTEDGRLGRNGLRLRRRLENGASTWEVELPEAPGEVALAAPGGPVAPPSLIADLLRVVVGDDKLVEVLTVRESDAAADMLGGPNRPAIDEPASPRECIRARFREQYEQILAHDPGSRLGREPEAVHKFRVAVRRLRALLRSLGSGVDRVWADQLRAELGWLGRALGEVRDRDVLLLRLRAQVEELDATDRTAARRLLARLEEERVDARVELEAVLGSGRYLTLLARLEEASEAPRWVGRKEQPLEQLAAKEFRRLQKAAAVLDGDPTDEQLHKARIRAKRARYAAEVAEPALGKPARRVIERAKEFQDVSGEHQDAVVAEETLRRLAEGAEPRVVAFAAGRLAELQHERRLRARREIPSAWKRLDKAGRKAWR